MGIFRRKKRPPQSLVQPLTSPSERAALTSPGFPVLQLDHSSERAEHGTIALTVAAPATAEPRIRVGLFQKEDAPQAEVLQLDLFDASETADRDTDVDVTESPRIRLGLFAPQG